MIYNFTYFNGDKVIYKSCITDREADVLFKILVSAKIPFKVITITKRRNKFYV